MSTIKQIELCDDLNLNFDEATELFSVESLNSMQTARVNGGIPWVGIAKEVIKVLGLVGTVLTIYDHFAGTMGPTERSGSDVNIKLPDGAEIKISYEQSGNTMKMGYDGNQVWVVISSPTPTK